MTSLAALGAYRGSDSESDDENQNCKILAEQNLHLTKPETSSVEVAAAPNVITKFDLTGTRRVDTKSGEIVFNPTAEELYTPEQVQLKINKNIL